jgi:N-acetylmuramidase/Putative peptidoglycan binding domain
MNFKGAARPLSHAGLAAALAAIDFAQGEAAFLWTVIEVETSGVTQGFGFRDDRRPHILFERHKFRQFTNRQFDAAAPDLSGPPGAYGSAVSQYSRIERAIDLCAGANLGEEPALKSASWGIGQVMGFNHAAAGYASATAMVTAMVDSEDGQLLAMANFLEDAGLANHLRARDWRKFAIGYNGPAQWKNKYEVKLAEHFQRFSSGSLPSLEVRAAQAALLFLGYAPGKTDGVIGPRTRNALASFRISHGLPQSIDIDAATFDRLSAEVGWTKP